MTTPDTLPPYKQTPDTLTPAQRVWHLERAVWLRARVDKCKPADLHLHGALLALANDHEQTAFSK